MILRNGGFKIARWERLEKNLNIGISLSVVSKTRITSHLEKDRGVDKDTYDKDLPYCR